MLAAKPLHLEACSGMTRIVMTRHSISKKETARSARCEAPFIGPSKRASNAFAAFSSNTLLACLVVCWSHSRPKQVSLSQRTKMQIRPRKQFHSNTGRTEAGVSKLMQLVQKGRLNFWHRRIELVNRWNSDWTHDLR